MDRFQLENIYRANGLTDYRLRNTDDLLKCHGIDYKAVDGYNRLDDLNRAIYQKFIVNIFNAWGLESRASLIPKGIYYVEDIEYLVKEHPDDDHFLLVGGVVKAIDRSDFKTILYTWVDEEYKHLEIVQSKPETYLRFEYEHQERDEWLHVIKEWKDWY